jgi:hypothetical protein
MVPQHQQITDWLGGLDFVDAERIGFYGLVLWWEIGDAYSPLGGQLLFVNLQRRFQRLGLEKRLNTESIQLLE